MFLNGSFGLNLQTSYTRMLLLAILNFTFNVHDIVHDIAHAGTLQSHKWENAMTIDYGTWGFRRNSNLTRYLPMENLVWQLVSTVR